MRPIHLLAAGLLGLAAAPLIAQTPATPATPGGARKPINYPGVSAAGNAILTKLDQQPDQQFVQLLRQRKSTQDQLSNAIMTATIDPERIATLMKQLDLLQSQIRSRSSDRVLTALKALPEEDRGPFLRAISNAVSRPAP